MWMVTHAESSSHPPAPAVRYFIGANTTPANHLMALRPDLRSILMFESDQLLARTHTRGSDKVRRWFAITYKHG